MATPGVYTGTWTDWTYGHIRGYRVTMTSKDAGLLIAFIAVFDGVVGTMTWNIIAYILHYLRAGNAPHDGLYHQMQALLRNSNEPYSFARRALSSGWHWRKRTSWALTRVLALCMLAVSTALLFSVAGVLSSQIASTGGVLLTSNGCQNFNWDLIGALGQIQADDFYYALDQQYSSLAKLSLEYARNCYINSLLNQSLLAATSLSPGAECDFYVTSVLNWTTTFGHECPFTDKTVCSVPNTEIIKLDTGYLDTNKDLGLNLPPENSVLFRRINTCSPLTTNGFSNNTFYETGIPGLLSNISVYMYGYNPIPPLDLFSIAQYEQFTNATFVYPAASYLAADTPYNLQQATVFTATNASLPSFIPDPRISEDPWGPVSLLFLANRVEFPQGAVTDPWFQATSRIEVDVLDYNNTYYSSALPGAVLGCWEQVEICNPMNGLCTNPDTWWYEYITQENMFKTLNMSDIQTSLSNSIISLSQNTGFEAIAAWLGGEVLEAYDELSSAFQFSSPTLPNNQWQIEMERLMAVSGALFQRLNLFDITGPTEQSLVPYFMPWAANDTVENTLCAAQRIRAAGYQSFSVLGLAINFIIGGIVIIGGLVATEVAPRIRRRNRAPGPRRAAWISQGVLQLQRQAYERVRGVEWEGDSDVPLTTGPQKFRIPSLTDSSTHVIALDGKNMRDVESSGNVSADKKVVGGVKELRRTNSEPGSSSESSSTEDPGVVTPLIMGVEQIRALHAL